MQSEATVRQQYSYAVGEFLLFFHPQFLSMAANAIHKALTCWLFLCTPVEDWIPLSRCCPCSADCGGCPLPTVSCATLYLNRGLLAHPWNLNFPSPLPPAQISLSLQRHLLDWCRMWTAVRSISTALCKFSTSVHQWNFPPISCNTCVCGLLFS